MLPPHYTQDQSTETTDDGTADIYIYQKLLSLVFETEGTQSLLMSMYVHA